jgi:hypothetical protein
MRAFLYDRDGKYWPYTGFSKDSNDHESQIRSLMTSSRMPLYTKIIVSDKLKRRVFHKEEDGWGKESIFVRGRQGWKKTNS